MVSSDVDKLMYFFFFSSRRRHTRFDCDWSSDVCSSDLVDVPEPRQPVDVLVATDVPDRRAAPADVDDRLRIVHGMVERVNKVLLVGFHELGGSKGHRVITKVHGGSRAVGPAGNHSPGKGRRCAADSDTS